MSETTPILPALDEAQRVDLLARLERLIDRSGGPEACHPFTGGSRVRGYGVLWTRQPDGRRRMVKAHRLMFEAMTGECPPTVDHRCHDGVECQGEGENCPHRLCCNPAHLAGESIAENARRAQAMRYHDRCARGHAMTPENTYESEAGERTCRKCAAENARAARERARAEKGRAPQRRKYRPRGMPLEDLVAWALEDNTDPAGCWSWRNVVPAAHGYVRVTAGRTIVTAHRLVYETLVGPIPEGYVIDHTCHDPATCEGGLLCPHRACVNPAHLAAVPPGENTAAERSSRKRVEECARGHAFTPENTYVDKRGSRHCRECGRRKLQAARAKAREGSEDARYRPDGRCRNGHDVAVVGVRPSGKCAECARQRQREYKARTGST